MQARVCDVYGTARGVKRYEVTVKEVDDQGAVVLSEALVAAQADLCPRALDRLKAKIEAGIKPPVTRKAKAVPSE